MNFTYLNSSQVYYNQRCSRITEDVLYTDVNVHINTNTIQCTQVIFPVGFVHHTVLPCFQLGINVQPLHYLWCQ